MRAVGELKVEVVDVGGSRGSAQLERLANDPTRVIAASRFLGLCEVPLQPTLHTPRGTTLCFVMIVFLCMKAAWYNPAVPLSVRCFL